MLTVGIHENVKLSSGTGLNEKGTLKVGLTQGEGKGSFDALVSGTKIDEEIGIFIFTPDVLQYGKTINKTPDALSKELQKIQTYIKDILRVYLTEDKVEAYIGGKGMQKLFADLGITSQKEFDSKIVEQPVMNHIISYVSKQFVLAVQTEKLVDSTTKFRIKLTRQSAKSHFPTFPKSVFDPWIENMEIPKEKSKIAWTDYEIKGGWNNPAQVTADSTPPQDAVTTDSKFTEPTTPQSEVDDLPFS
jgi:hypothetical protein